MRSRTQVLIAFVSAMAVTMVAVSDVRRTSPGELSSVHRRVDELAGKNDCSECHGGLFGSMKAACLECHEPIAAQLEQARGLHGTLGARSEQCGLCHAEHHGATAPLVHGQSFALAGVQRADDFDHRLIGFVLDGAHAPLECSACHVNARVAVLPAGETRFLGLERDCASCHEDAHHGERASACASCHGQESWKELASPDHEEFLPLVGAHALDCLECHAAEGEHALAIVGGKGPRPPARDCRACHESPHRASFLAGVAARAGLGAGQVCGSCHGPAHGSFHEEELARMSPEQHAFSGFPLSAPHDAPACADCHGEPEEADFAARFPGRLPGACSVCHVDVHEGQFQEGPFAGRECDACHEPERFEPHAFGVEEHALAALELTDSHVAVACEDCHAAPPHGARRFRGTPTECAACHADGHQGFFAPFLAGRAQVEHGECAHCHDASRFAAAAEGFDHEGFTGFAVSGAHAQSACESCHVPAAEPDASGRAFGRVEDHFGSFTGCVTCHADPHGGRFDPERGAPAQVEGRGDCARCHGENSFRTLRRPFDHGFWTGFGLAGPHAAAACTACHAPLPAGDVGRTTALATGPACADCHEDPHAGQFADEFGSSDCSRCHAAERADLLAFDHERDARFALGAAHQDLACTACHGLEERAGLAFARYRPLGRECTDCHGSNAEVLLRRQPRR